MVICFQHLTNIHALFLFTWQNDISNNCILMKPWSLSGSLVPYQSMMSRTNAFRPVIVQLSMAPFQLTARDLSSSDLPTFKFVNLEFFTSTHTFTHKIKSQWYLKVRFIKYPNITLQVKSLPNNMDRAWDSWLMLDKYSLSRSISTELSNSSLESCTW